MSASLLRDRRGGTGFVEALIAVALVAFVAIGGVEAFGAATEEKFEEEASWLASGTASARTGGVPVHEPGTIGGPGSIPSPSPGPTPRPGTTPPPGATPAPGTPPAPGGTGGVGSPIRVGGNPSAGWNVDLWLVEFGMSTDGETTSFSVGRNVGKWAGVSVAGIVDANNWLRLRGAEVAGSVGESVEAPGGARGPDGQPLEVGAKVQGKITILDGEVTGGLGAEVNLWKWAFGMPLVEWTFGRLWGEEPPPRQPPP